MTLSDPLRVTKMLIHELEKLEIPYLVGGSLASSLYGIPRATQDVDVVIDISEAKMEMLCDALKESFFVDEQVALRSTGPGEVFNIIEKEDLFKIDLFICGTDDFSRLEMQRRTLFSLSDDAHDKIVMCSPEDIIVHKLFWYQLGDGVSDRQWNDALNVIKVQKKLDKEYLRLAADKKGVLKLLEKALAEAADKQIRSS